MSPYIKKANRNNIDKLIAQLSKYIWNEGELNYAITKLLIMYTYKREVNYSTLNAVMGVMSCASQEFYRRVISDFEDERKETEGDVY